MAGNPVPPPNPPAGEIYCTVCTVLYAKGLAIPGGGPNPLIGIVWLPTIYESYPLLVCYPHGLAGYNGP